MNGTAASDRLRVLRAREKRLGNELFTCAVLGSGLGIVTVLLAVMSFRFEALLLVPLWAWLAPRSWWLCYLDIHTRREIDRLTGS